MGQGRDAENLIEAWGDWIDTREFYRDDPDFGAIGSCPLSSISDRQDGKFPPFYETQADLAFIRGSARNLRAIDAVAIGALESLKNYVFGPTGFKFTAQPKKGTEPRTGLVSLIQSRGIDRFLSGNDFTGDMDREIADRAHGDGEGIVTLTREDDEVRASIAEPDQLIQPGSPHELHEWLTAQFDIDCDSFVPSWTFGVLTPQRHTDHPLGYYLVYDSTGADWDFYPASRVQHFKRNVPRKAKRGVSDYQVILKDLHHEAKLGTNMAVGAALQAAIAWIEEMPPGTTQGQVQAMNLGQAQTTVNRPSTVNGTQSRTVREQRAGSIVQVSNGKKYHPGPMGSERASDFILVAQYVLRRIGIRWCMPEYMISGDASNSNLASTLVAESPFVKARESDQQWYAVRFESLLWKAIRLLWEAGVFGGGVSWEEIRATIEIKVDAPAVATRDPLILAQTHAAYLAAGVISKQTARTEAGKDADAEKEQIRKEAAEAGAGVHSSQDAAADGSAQTGSPPQSKPEVSPALQAAVAAALESVESTPEAKAILSNLAFEGYP